MIDIEKVNFAAGSNRLSLKLQDKTTVISDKKQADRKKKKKQSASDIDDDGLPHIDEFV